ncbi:MAG TPA: 4-hydroxyphenylpyruvate dioxygenase [Rhodocyclaceae bacterium]|nr:4-hydroxyphenylpyruvate dioxygenase [Rhodocyclaceae bacterium]HNH36730.1 4-hydroxyphenylpyruvate dioxygenase [Rhodocyclaceae bacterium]
MNDNPMGTDGFEFIEFAAPDPAALDRMFRTLGFTPIARHRSKEVTLYRQGEINFILNAEPESFAQSFARVHGPSICAIAWRVKDARAAAERAKSLGADVIPGNARPMELNIPAIRGIGGSLIYLVDRYGPGVTIYDIDFVPLAQAPARPAGAGLLAVDHLTHNVHRGRMNVWAEFYQRLFGFREIRQFDIEGRQTGLHSRAMVSPCGKIRIPINEAADRPGGKGQIEEFLDLYRGEGIQHVALAASDIHAATEALRRGGVRFLDTPDAYYDAVEARLPGHGQDLARLRSNRVLIDGDGAGGLLLQIFTETVIGPIFFELIERRGNEGFGEGNFKALFDAMEQDQVRRGVLPER